jgi:hypothetical protein
VLKFGDREQQEAVVEYASRWNTLAKLVRANDVMLVHDATLGETRVRPSGSNNARDATGRRLCEVMLSDWESAAHFVITPQLSRLMREKRQQFGSSLLDLAEAGLLKLPFDKVLIEMEDPDVVGATMFVRLSRPEDDPKAFSMIKFDVVKTANGRETAVFWPLDIEFELEVDPTKAKDDDARAALKVSLTPFHDTDKALQTQEIVEALRATCFYALIFGCMLWRTKGVVRETVSAPTKLNKARVRRGQSPLRDYSVLRVGSVFDREGRAHEVKRGFTGWAMPIHWRCGHWRNQACGPGWRDHRRLWIEPQLVNYDGEQPAPQPKFLATV